MSTTGLYQTLYMLAGGDRPLFYRLDDYECQPMRVTRTTKPKRTRGRKSDTANSSGPVVLSAGTPREPEQANRVERNPLPELDIERFRKMRDNA